MDIFYTMHNQSLPPILILIAIAASLALYGVLLTTTTLAYSPFVIFFAAVFLLYPLRRESPIAARLYLLLWITLSFWLIKELAALFLPFIIAFALAYMLEPTMTYSAKHKMPRFVMALALVLTFVGTVAGISIFVFPVIFSQLNDILRELSSLLTNATNYLESRKFFRLLSSYGLNSPETRDLIQKELVPRLEGSFGAIFRTMLSFLTSLSGIISQVINAILTPILLFYFLRDFARLKVWLIQILSGKNDELLYDLRRIHHIVQAYIAGQAIAALLIAIVASLLFSIFGIPYPIVLGLVCGILNPIPYVGMFASIIIGFITVIVVGYPDSLLTSLFVIVGVVTGLHLVDNYGIQPRIVGKRVGLHPLMLISALFVFGHFFGVVGLLFAVPSTAALLMFFNDWLQQRLLSSLPESTGQTTTSSAS